MPKKIKPTSGQISMLVVHTVVFIIGSAIMQWINNKQSVNGWAYPWQAWIIAAWALCLLGHFCLVFTSTEDQGYTDYRRQQGYDK